MKRPTRILAVAGAVLVLLLVLLLVLPLLFRGQIEARVKTAVNQSVNARVDWRDVGLSFFRHFPDLTLSLDDLTAVGVDKFQGDTLAAVHHFRVSLSLPSVLSNVMGGSGPIVVRTVELDQPRLRLIALEDGTANWDIARKTPAAQPQAKAAKPMAISLRRFQITGAAVALDNRQSKLKASLAGYNQSLSGDFSQSRVGVKTQADADTVSVTFAGIPYLNRVRLGLTADVQADLAGKSYTLKTTELRLNDLKLGVSGSAKSAGKLLGLDLTFAAPSTNFRSILSLVPAIYAHDFDKVKTAGSIAVNGRVKGDYGPGAFPSFAINTKVNNAAFQYPDLPLPARDINVDLSLTNPGGSPDSTVVKLDRFHLVLGRNPVDATLTVRTPISDPDVDARVAGKVDLADVRRTVKLEGIDQLAGTVAANAAVRTRMSYVDKKQYDKVNASGTVDVAGLTMKGKTLAAPARDPAGVARARASAGAAQVVQRHHRQQRHAGVGHAREPAGVRLPRRHPARHRDRPQQQVQSRRMAVRWGRAADHTGAAQNRLRPRRDRGRADLRQPQDGERPRQASGEGPARDAGELPDEHARR
jgi:Uncharacterized protein involved in outer membrane biogenesis